MAFGSIRTSSASGSCPAGDRDRAAATSRFGPAPPVPRRNTLKPRFRHHDLGEPQFRDARDHVAGELVGLARRGPVADRDELHAMPRARLAERPDRPFPVVSRFVRVDGGGVEQLAGAVDDGDLGLDGANAGIEPHRDALTGRRGQQQVVQVAAEHADRLGFCLLAQAVRCRSRGC